MPAHHFSSTIEIKICRRRIRSRCISEGALLAFASIFALLFQSPLLRVFNAIENQSLILVCKIVPRIS